MTHKLTEGWHYEIMALMGGRARIIETDGHTTVADFW